MEEAARCRESVGTALRNIEPDALREAMEATIENGSTAPGALALVSARAALRERDSNANPDADPSPSVPDHVDERAAGVQLIYEGLRSIRDLARDEPWKGVVTVEDSSPEVDLTDENLGVLAADVLVARGFYLLARTDAAAKAVETVRNFARDRTAVRSGEDRIVELEVDIFQLAVIAGVTAVEAEPLARRVSMAADVARRVGAPLPPAETVIPEFEFGETVDRPSGAEGAARTSATDP
jgi:hypothetical protein